MPDRPAEDAAGLPDFEGDEVVGVVTKLNGSGGRIRRALHHGDKLVLVVEAEVASIAHPKRKDGLVRVQTLAAADLYDAGAAGHDLLATLRSKADLDDDDAQGRTRLPLAAAPEKSAKTKASGKKKAPKIKAVPPLPDEPDPAIASTFGDDK